MTVKTSLTDDWERTLGSQVRRACLRADLDQATLAKRASISIGALRNLETGSGARITTLAPEPELGPIDRLEGRIAPAEPKRASRKRGGEADG